LSYRELAARQRWKLDSARKTVLRHGWEKTKSPDGTHVLIKVPTSFLGVEPRDEVTDATAMHLEGLQVAVDAERRRAATAEADRDAWRSQALSNGAVIQKLLERL
jgi:hypothetical protein